MKNEKTVKWTLTCLFFITLAVVELIIYQLYLLEKNKQDKINERVRSEFIVLAEDESEEDDSEYEYEDDDFYQEDSDQIRADYKKFIFVGDSRYKGMEIFAQDNDIFLSESGRGYDYLLGQISNIKYYADADTAIIIGLGVNDNLVSAAKDYITTLSELQSTVEGQVYFMLVNPVDEEKEEYNGYSVKNGAIDAFNDAIKNGMDKSVGIIDTNSYLKEIGYETQDGLHYVDQTYESIYNYIKNDITEN